VSEKAKLIRGDPPKIDFKKKGEPPNKRRIKLLSMSFLGKVEKFRLNNNNNNNNQETLGKLKRAKGLRPTW